MGFLSMADLLNGDGERLRQVLDRGEPLTGMNALMLRTGWSLVRLTVPGPASVAMVSSVSVTSIVTVFPALTRPRATFCPTTITTLEFDARHWTRTGPVAGCGGGPAGRTPRSQLISARVRSSWRVSRSKKVRVTASIRMPTRCLTGTGLDPAGRNRSAGNFMFRD
jgi:hypothetical protein